MRLSMSGACTTVHVKVPLLGTCLPGTVCIQLLLLTGGCNGMQTCMMLRKARFGANTDAAAVQLKHGADVWACAWHMMLETSDCRLLLQGSRSATQTCNVWTLETTCTLSWPLVLLLSMVALVLRATLRQQESRYWPTSCCLAHTVAWLSTITTFNCSSTREVAILYRRKAALVIM